MKLGASAFVNNATDSDSMEPLSVKGIGFYFVSACRDVHQVCAGSGFAQPLQ